MKKITSILFTVMLVGSIMAQQRGRPVMSNGTLVSDMGTRLRGCYIATDYYHKNQSQINKGTKSGIYKARDEYGMNAFHFYCGRDGVEITPTGTYQPLADSLVKWTREAGVYLVMTIGGAPNDQFDLDKVKEFWSYYAPRYADETHVIYEIKNEPEFICNSASADPTIEMQIIAYDTIRKYAPNTHIITMSYGGTASKASYIESDIQAMEAGGIDFSNVSIGYHGYHWCSKARKHENPKFESSTELNIIPQLQAKGYTFINTEFKRDSTLEGSKNYSGKLIEFYENDLEMSWLCFYSFPWDSETAKQSLFNPNIDFKGKVDAMGASWCPDYGTWPLDASVCQNDKYNLTVTNGSTSGEYFSGSMIEIIADKAPEGKIFDKWSGDTEHVGNVYDSITTVTIPELDVNIEAMYKDIVTHADNKAADLSSVVIYPNPLSENSYFDIMLSGKTQEGIDVKIINVAGSVVYKKEFEATGNKIQVAHGALTPAVYFVTISNSEYSVVRKLVVR